MKEQTIQLKCECTGEALEVNYDMEENVYYFSIWTMGTKGVRISLLHRLKHCWQILRWGHPYGDQLVISQASLNKLMPFINDQSSK